MGTAEGIASAFDGVNSSKDPMKNLAVGGLESMVFTAINNTNIYANERHVMPHLL